MKLSARLARLHAERVRQLIVAGRAALEAQFGHLSDAELETLSMSEGSDPENARITDAIFAHLTEDELDILGAPHAHQCDLPRITPLMWKHLSGTARLTAREQCLLLALPPVR
jgi:hypothetical protein